MSRSARRPSIPLPEDAPLAFGDHSRQRRRSVFADVEAKIDRLVGDVRASQAEAEAVLLK